ncbi:MAG: hypothetical protein F4101_09215 [Nitrospira sp. SB0673_bin_12]|nr:hypothetical protein [Nitrospira sp. SB0673_bin_12]
MGWGLRALEGTAVLTPFVGATLAGEGTRTLNLGGRLRTGEFQVELTGTINEADNNAASTYGLMLQGALLW